MLPACRRLTLEHTCVVSSASAALARPGFNLPWDIRLAAVSTIAIAKQAHSTPVTLSELAKCRTATTAAQYGSPWPTAGQSWPAEPGHTTQQSCMQCSVKARGFGLIKIQRAPELHGAACGQEGLWLDQDTTGT